MKLGSLMIQNKNERQHDTLIHLMVNSRRNRNHLGIKLFILVLFTEDLKESCHVWYTASDFEIIVEILKGLLELVKSSDVLSIQIYLNDCYYSCLKLVLAASVNFSFHSIPVM